jgi:hypothetical protein
MRRSAAGPPTSAVGEVPPDREAIVVVESEVDLDRYAALIIPTAQQHLKAARYISMRR